MYSGKCHPAAGGSGINKKAD